MNPSFIAHPLPAPSPRLVTSPNLSHHPRHSICKSALPPLPSLSQVQTKLTDLQTRTQSIKCPFWRRRFTDALDSLNQVFIWALNRHKSLPIPRSYAASVIPKTPNLPLESRLQILQNDFEQRQYYVTGRLSQQLYRDDCLFDGPDPDVPVRGLLKYVSAAAGLFDKRTSKVDLIDIRVENAQHGHVIVAHWRLQGNLNLPWRPAIKPYTGTTTYSFDENALIKSHVETWSVTAFDAFVSVMFPGFGQPPAPPV